MSVLYDVKQDWTLLGVERYEESIVEDKQLASLYLLQLRFYSILCLCHFQRTEHF